ncbi:MAG: Ig-like domain-containing protein, partial [Clostridia bacterium]
DKDGPSITLSATPSTPTNGAVTVTATIVDTATGIAEQKWASGNQDTAYFAANGTVLDKDTFIVTKNGTYTVYAKDQLGNETVQTIDVTTISNIPPSPNYPVPSPTYPVTGVSLNQSTVKLQEKGAPATLLATITPSYATLQQVTWSSSDEKVATVDQNGVVTPHAAGEAVITVKTIDGNFTAESKVTVQAVQAVTVTALELKDTSLLLKPGKSTRIKVYAVYSDGTKAEISRNKGTAYKTDSSLVTVGKGLIRTGKKEGEARVSIQFEGMTAELLVVVNKKQLEGIELPADSVTLEQGEEEQLHASARWSNKELDDVTDTALWFSSDDKIVSVEQGKIKAVEPGTATITVVYGDKKAAIEVEITEAKKIRRLTASKSSVSLKEGNRQKITLTAIFTDNTKSTVTEKAEWQSDDEEIAKVEAGVIKAVAPGTTTVTATYRGKVYKIKVNVKK